VVLEKTHHLSLAYHLVLYAQDMEIAKDIKQFHFSSPLFGLFLAQIYTAIVEPRDNCSVTFLKSAYPKSFYSPLFGLFLAQTYTAIVEPRDNCSVTFLKYAYPKSF
jgi:hypothetical protein